MIISAITSAITFALEMALKRGEENMRDSESPLFAAY